MTIDSGMQFELAKLCSLRHSLLLQPCEVEKIKCAYLTENTMEDIYPGQAKEIMVMPKCYIDNCVQFFFCSFSWLLARGISLFSVFV